MATIQCPVCNRQVASDERLWNNHLRGHGIERVSAQIVFKGKLYAYDKLVYRSEVDEHNQGRNSL